MRTWFLISVLLGLILGPSFVRAQPPSNCEVDLMLDQDYPLLCQYRNGRTWVNLKEVADLMGIQAGNRQGSMVLYLPEGPVTFTEGSPTLTSVKTTYPPLERPPIRVKAFLWVTLDSLPLFLDLSIDRNQRPGHFLIYRNSVLANFKTQEQPTAPSAVGKTASVAGGSGGKGEEDFEVNPESFYPQFFDLKGALSTWDSYDPLTRYQYDYQTLTASGNFGDIPLALNLGAQTYNSTTRVVNSYLEAGKPSLKIRLGDSTESLSAFNYQTEVRRGIRVSSETGEIALAAYFSPAEWDKHFLNPSLTPKTVGGVQGSFKNKSFRLSGDLLGVVPPDQFQIQGSPSGRLKASLDGSVFLPFKNTLSAGFGTSGLKNLFAVDSSKAYWVGADADNPFLKGRFFYEKIGLDFQTLGDPKNYSGTERLEFSPRLSVLAPLQPYYHYSRIQRDVFDGRPSFLRLYQAKGLVLKPEPSLQLDFSLGDEKENGLDRRHESVLSMLWNQKVSRLYARLDVNQFKTLSPGTDFSGILQAGFNLEESLSAVFSSNPSVFENSDGTPGTLEWMNQLELYFQSWDQNWAWRFQAAHTLRQRGGNVSYNYVSGLAGLDFRWGDFRFQPEMRIYNYSLDYSVPVNYSVDVRLTYNFSVRAVPMKGTLQGVMFEDKNKNQRQDGGEQGLPRITLILDGEMTVATDESGRFHFEGLLPGIHYLEVDWDSVPIEYRRNFNLNRMIDTGKIGQRDFEIPLEREDQSSASPASPPLASAGISSQDNEFVDSSENP